MAAGRVLQPQFDVPPGYFFLGHSRPNVPNLRGSPVSYNYRLDRLSASVRKEAIPSFLDSGFSTTRFLADVRFVETFVALAFRVVVPRALREEEGATDEAFAGFSSLESAIALLLGDSGESVVRERFESLGLWVIAVVSHRACMKLLEGRAYSSDPSLEPRFRPLEFRTLESGFTLVSCLLTSSILLKTSSSYSASREFIVVLRLWFMSFADCFGSSDGEAKR